MVWFSCAHAMVICQLQCIDTIEETPTEADQETAKILLSCEFDFHFQLMKIEQT